MATGCIYRYADIPFVVDCALVVVAACIFALDVAQVQGEAAEARASVASQSSSFEVTRGFLAGQVRKVLPCGQLHRALYLPTSKLRHIVACSHQRALTWEQLFSRSFDQRSSSALRHSLRLFAEQWGSRLALPGIEADRLRMPSLWLSVSQVGDLTMQLITAQAQLQDEKTARGAGDLQAAAAGEAAAKLQQRDHELRQALQDLSAARAGADGRLSSAAEAAAAQLQCRDDELQQLRGELSAVKSEAEGRLSAAARAADIQLRRRDDELQQAAQALTVAQSEASGAHAASQQLQSQLAERDDTLAAAFDKTAVLQQHLSAAQQAASSDGAAVEMLRAQLTDALAHNAEQGIELAAVRGRLEEAGGQAAEARAQKAAAEEQAAAALAALQAARHEDQAASDTIGELQMAAAMQGETLQQLQARQHMLLDPCQESQAQTMQLSFVPFSC